MSKYKVIDISYWNGGMSTGDFKKVIADGIDAVIIRCGYSSKGSLCNKDSKFVGNLKNAKNAGLPVGAYFYGAATSVAEAKKEAKYAVSLCKGKGLKYPLFYDVEDNATMGKLSKGELTDVVKEFCKIVEESGLKTGVYASYSWLESKMGTTGYSVWVAQYNDTCDYKGSDKVAWQYSSSHKIKGINHKFDISNFYKDYGSATPSSKKAYSGKLPTKQIQYGSKGGAVKLWQKFLNWSVGAGLKVDGKFGTATKRWTEIFQKKVGLTVDGIAGVKTLAHAKAFKR